RQYPVTPLLPYATPSRSRAAALGLLIAVPPLIWNAARTGGDAFGVQRYGLFMAEVWRPQTLLQIPHGAAKRPYRWTPKASPPVRDRKSTRLNSSHQITSY